MRRPRSLAKSVRFLASKHLNLAHTGIIYRVVIKTGPVMVIATGQFWSSCYLAKNDTRKCILVTCQRNDLNVYWFITYTGKKKGVDAPDVDDIIQYHIIYKRTQI
jgi:hypothetical protein